MDHTGKVLQALDPAQMDQLKEILLPGKGSVDLQAGDVLSIRTPGGGGFGNK